MSGLIFGTLCFGQSLRIRTKSVDEKQAYLLLDTAFQHGIRDFDTASIYGEGLAEIWLGHWVRSRNIEGQVRVRTKVGIKLGAQWERTNSFKEDCLQSMDRLGLDHIFQVSLHVFPNQPLEQLAREIDEVFEQGLIQVLASTNEPITKVNHLNEYLTSSQIKHLQLKYNLLDRHLERLEGLDSPYSVEAWSPRGSGLLTSHAGKLPSQWKHSKWQRERNAQETVNALNALELLADQKGTTPDALAIAWILSKDIDACFGTRCSDDLINCSMAQKIKLEVKELSFLDSLCPPKHPYQFKFMDRFG